MAFIGAQPTIGNFVKLDAISTSSTNTYNLTLDSVAFSPESPNHCLVSLNGVIQSPSTSFSISGSTITFIPSSGTLSSSDSIDFIMVYGNVLDLGVPSDATVTNAKTNFVSTSSNAGLQIKGDGTTDGTLQLNCSQNSHGIKLKSPAHSTSSSYTLTFPGTDPSADKFLKTDGSGNLSFADAGGGGKILQVLQGSHTSQASMSSTSFVDVSSNTNVSLTCASTSSKVFIIANFHELYLSGSHGMKIRVTAGGSQIMRADNLLIVGNSGEKVISQPLIFLYSPNSTSAIEYKMQFASSSGSEVRVNQHSTTAATLTLMEVGA